MCTETEKDHELHKSDFHTYPAIKGWISKQGQLMNDVTCEDIAYQGWMIRHPETEEDVDGLDYFTNEAFWHVDKIPAFLNENKNAFWSWALLHFKDKYENRY